MTSVKYSTHNDLNEIIGIDSHIDFAESLIKKYRWTPDIEKQLKALLQKIRDKQNDDKFNLSVVGEFSTGKSSFINALLRCDLLPVNVLQGTTIASAIIEYSDRYKMVLRYKKGKIESHMFNNLEDMKEMHKMINSDPKIGKSLDKVMLYLPSEALKAGIRIIDTPGTNSLERWHEETTRRAIRELSDVSIILTSASAPFPESFCDFVEENLSDVLNQCLIVATKIDTIPEDERCDQLEYIKVKACQRFETDMIPVLPYASLETAKTYTDTDENPDRELLEMSLESEKKIFNYMAKQRGLAQFKKLMTLIGMIYDSASKQLNGIKSDYENELKMLKKSKTADFSEFITDQKKSRQDSFKSKSEEVLTDVQNTIYELPDKCVDSINSKIDGYGSCDSVQNYISQTLVNDCKEETSRMVLEARTAAALFQKKFKEVISDFQEAFYEKFTDLEILKVDFNIDETTSFTPAVIELKNMNSATQYLSEQSSKEVKTILGGAAAGAAAGTLIAPGIGTIIGAVFGFIAGSMMTPDDSAVINDAKNKLKAPLKSYFETAAHDAYSSLKEYVDTISKRIDAEIDKYIESYKNIVDERIKKEEKKRGDIEWKISGIRMDMDSITQRKTELNSMIAQLSKAL